MLQASLLEAGDDAEDTTVNEPDVVMTVPVGSVLLDSSDPASMMALPVVVLVNTAAALLSFFLVKTDHWML